MARIFGPSEELNSELLVDDNSHPQTRTIRRSDPTVRTLPGNPFVELDQDAVRKYMKTTMMTSELNQLAPHLWLLGTKSSSSISTLHMQIILGRTIIKTERAELHLLWHRDKVLVKPLPSWLLSSAFWDFFLEDQNTFAVNKDSDRRELYEAATGFVRSYFYLIQSELDFNLAVEHSLIPSGITPERFSKFIRLFHGVSDDMVSPRFHYGELRLSRINRWSIIFLQRMEYFDMSRQYDAYFSGYFQFFLFVFATFAVLLGAMQVALAVQQLPNDPEGSWTVFAYVCRWTAVITITFATLVGVGLLGLWGYKLLNELIFAIRSIL